MGSTKSMNRGSLERRSEFAAAKIAGVLVALVTFVALDATVAAAHCCHDERTLGAAAQSGLRPGLHGLGEGLTDDSIQADPPAADDSLDMQQDESDFGFSRYGQMHGNSFGNYGAGSIGQTGPGGLGAMRNGGLGGGPVRPR